MGVVRRVGRAKEHRVRENGSTGEIRRWNMWRLAFDMDPWGRCGGLSGGRFVGTAGDPWQAGVRGAQRPLHIEAEHV